MIKPGYWGDRSFAVDLCTGARELRRSVRACRRHGWGFVGMFQAGSGFVLVLFILFHPRPDRATDPNAGLVHYEPRSQHPLHTPDFAQVWYILEGPFQIGEAT